MMQTVGTPAITGGRAHSATVVLALVIAVLNLVVAGCGNTLPPLPAARALVVSECDGADPDQPVESVVLNWFGGAMPLTAGDSLDALNLSLFLTADGGTLADGEDRFKEDVRLQVTQIFCDSDGPKVHVRQATVPDDVGETTVYLSQAVSRTGQSEIGEGEFDPCNRRHDNAAVVYGEEIRRFAGINTFEDWVLLFANVSAHEIAHTLGYDHIDRRDSAAAERPVFVELMLNGHTLEQLRSPQRLVVPQTLCPRNATLLRRTNGGPVITCSAVE